MSQIEGFDYPFAITAMERMVETSQKPDEGNRRFVEEVGDFLSEHQAHIQVVDDPDYDDRALLVAEFGDPQGDQVLAAISHSDVVGVDGQSWRSNPWKLHIEEDRWYARGVCDTHGSGVAMIMAAMRQDVVSELDGHGKKISILFTSDEEAPTAELSYRGAKLAAGMLGVSSVVTADYFIAGEPTEMNGELRAMRAHKGRWLIQLDWIEELVGHSAESVRNAFTSAIKIGNEIILLAERGLDGGSDTEVALLFNPPNSTIQITAAEIKNKNFSTTPDTASLYVDLRTLPGYHNANIDQLMDVIMQSGKAIGVTPKLSEIDNFSGTSTHTNSPIVLVAEQALGNEVIGFNGGDEGEVMRRAGKQGITLGPGSLGNAHAPNESLTVDSMVRATNAYAHIFRKSVHFERINNLE